MRPPQGTAPNSRGSFSASLPEHSFGWSLFPFQITATSLCRWDELCLIFEQDLPMRIASDGIHPRRNLAHGLLSEGGAAASRS